MPLEVHVAGAWQVPAVQMFVQHCAAAEHPVPFAWHGVAHVFVASQKPEQQSALVEQVAASAPQALAQWSVASQ